MYTREHFHILSHLATGRSAALSVACVCLLLGGARAQINRAHPPPPPSGGQGGVRPSSPGGNSGGRTLGGADAHTDRGRMPSVPAIGGAKPSSDRVGSSSRDRFNKSREGSASKPSKGANALFFPYYPYGYSPYGYDPYGYPPNGYPYPYPPYPNYPSPGDRSLAIARYDSPYFYCTDLPGGQYVSGTAVIIAKPKRLYTPTPIYKNGELSEWRDLGVEDYLADRNADNGDYRVREDKAVDSALDAAVADIKLSWARRDVEPLARHLRKETQVAIILHGKYLYSLEPGDFLELTRSAYSSGPPLRFVLDHIHRRGDGIYTVTGRHLFKAPNGTERTVYFSYVLASMEDNYVLTQIASASDKE